jgi:tRNA-specific 2-thiouridylase
VIAVESDLDKLNIRLGAPTTQEWRPGDDPDRDIAVLMSGGVDSSVTAMLLRDAGWNVLGITMKIPVAENCDVKRSCCGLEAGYVARDLGVAHYYLDVREAFEQLVIEPFRRAYEQGRTPSPCVDCNTLFKFGLVWNFIEAQFGVSSLATGHYARVVRCEGRAYLVRGEDRSRDQSYFLYGVPRERLDRFYLPLGDLSKPEVRRLAREAKLPVARRQDSMELCFAAEGDYRAALGSRTEKGPILDAAGNAIGEHDGIANYTVGQRKGVRIAAGKPLYVTAISAVDNSITLGTRGQAETCEVRAEDVNVLIPELMLAGQEIYGKIRSQGEPSSCVLTEVDGSNIGVRFDEPQFAPTPGQRLVLYDGEGRVVAGGVICSGTS